MLFQKGNSKLDSVSLDKIEIENKQTNKKVPLKNYSASKILSIPSIYFDCCLSKLHNKTSTMQNYLYSSNYYDYSAKYSSKHSKSDSASKSSQPFLSFLSSSSLPSLFPPNTNTPIIYVAILRKPVSSLAFAVIHRVSVAHNTLSFQVVCCLRLIAAVTAMQQLQCCWLLLHFV